MIPLFKYLSCMAYGLQPTLSNQQINRIRSKIRVFSQFTKNLSGLSTCRRPNSSIGCVVIPSDMSEVMAIGYNGPASGEDHMCCRGPEAVGSCGCIHAEANALVKIKTRRRNLVMIVSLSPCEHCAGLIINNKSIAVVIYSSMYRDDSGLRRLDNAGIITLSLSKALGETVEEAIENEMGSILGMG